MTDDGHHKTNADMLPGEVSKAARWNLERIPRAKGLHGAGRAEGGLKRKTHCAKRQANRQARSKKRVSFCV